MSLYPDVPGQRAAALARDLVVVALLVLFGWLGLGVYHAVDELTVVGEGVTSAGAAVEGGFESAADAVDATPVVGDELAGGLRGAGEGTGGNVAELGREAEDRVHRLARLLGALTFALPALLLLVQYLPPRIGEARRLGSARRALGAVDGEEGRRLVAMRAAFSLPYGRLLRYTSDPFGDLAAHRYEPLLQAAFEDAGLRPRD